MPAENIDHAEARRSVRIQQHAVHVVGRAPDQFGLQGLVAVGEAHVDIVDGGEEILRVGDAGLFHRIGKAAVDDDAVFLDAGIQFTAAVEEDVLVIGRVLHVRGDHGQDGVLVQLGDGLRKGFFPAGGYDGGDSRKQQGDPVSFHGAHITQIVPFNSLPRSFIA